MEERKFEIDPATLIDDLRSNWLIILLGTIAAAMLAFVVAGIIYVPEYTASATYVVSAGPNANIWNNMTYGNDAAKTFQSVIESKAMKKIVMGQIGREDLDAAIRTELPQDTNMLILKVTDRTPQGAIDLIGKLMDSYDEVSYVLGNATIDVLADPQMPLEPDNELNRTGAAVKGAAAGLLLMLMIIGFISCYRDTLRRESDIESKLDTKSMGAIPFEEREKTLRDYFVKKKCAPLINNPLTSFSFVEAYKRLAVKVDYQMAKEDKQILVVTSVAENEGKSTVAANLAIALAEQSKKVLLIDGDLRRPAQFLIFGMTPKENEELGEFLKRPQVEIILKKSGIQNLYLVLGKNGHSNSTEMLRSKRLSDFLRQCRNYMDYVIIDSAPAGLTGDAEILADYGDAVLFVSKQNTMAAEDINDVMDGFRENHSSVLGVVLNGVKSFSRLQMSGRYGDYGSYGNYNKNRGK